MISWYVVWNSILWKLLNDFLQKNIFVSLEPVIVKEKQSSFKRIFYFICGFSNQNEEEQKLEEENSSKDTERKREILKSLKQTPCVKKFLYINIVILFTAFTFFSIYFTVPDDGPTKPTIEIPNTLFIKNGTRPYI